MICFAKNAQVYEHVIKYDADVRFTEYRGSEKKDGNEITVFQKITADR